jgi:NAD-dependent deacetylase
MAPRLSQIIGSSTHIVFFGGAGVSTESGIPDFRSAHGIYSATGTYSPEEVVSHSFFEAHTEDFYEFYREHLLHPEAKPNNAHKALAHLEHDGKLDAIVTQNIDGLHQAAGSKTVWELHGSVLRNYCLRCGKRYGLDKILNDELVPSCDCGGIIRPDVVLYEEGLDERMIEGAIEAISHADTLIIGGTSLVVYPAAGLVRYFRGDNLVLINRTPTGADHMADCIVREPIGEALSPWA